MILPEAQRNYDFVQENQRNNLIEQADNHIWELVLRQSIE